MGFVIDTSVWVRAERNGLTVEAAVEELIERHGDEDLAISVITAGELLHGCWRAADASQRARRQTYVETILANFELLPVDLGVMRVYAEIDANLADLGKRLHTSDLLVACSALVRGDAVVTGNPRHFDRVPGLKVLVLR